MTVQVGIDGVRLASVRISSDWRDHLSVEQLSAEVSQAIVNALPEPPGGVERQFTPVRRDLTIQELQEVMELQKAWRKELNHFRAREAAGELIEDGPMEIVDPRERLSISFVGNRFGSLFLNPDWAKSASLQAISDAIFEITEGVDLVRDLKFYKALEAVSERDAAIRRITH